MVFATVYGIKLRIRKFETFRGNLVIWSFRSKPEQAVADVKELITELLGKNPVVQNGAGHMYWHIEDEEELSKLSILQ